MQELNDKAGLYSNEKALAFGITMPAFVDVINVFLQTTGIGFTSLVTASIYVMTLLYILKYQKPTGIDVFILSLFYLLFYVNYVFFPNTRSLLTTKEMLIIYFFAIPYGVFSFRRVRCWSVFFDYLYLNGIVAIFSGGFMLLFLQYEKYLIYMDYSFALLPSICACYYKFRRYKGTDLDYVALIITGIGGIEIVAFGARACILYAVLYVAFLELIRSDTSIDFKVIIGTVFGIIGSIVMLQLNNILLFLSTLSAFKNSYLIWTFLNGKMYSVKTREIIWDACFERLHTMGLQVGGFFSDRPYCGGGVYPHNIVLEIVMSWGWIIGGGIVLLLVVIILKAFLSNGIKQLACLFILLTCLGRFAMSGTYVAEGKFWTALFAFWAIAFCNDSETPDSYENNGEDISFSIEQ